MASTEHTVLTPQDAENLWGQGATIWNAWVEANPAADVDFSGLDFRGYSEVSFEGFNFPDGKTSFSETRFGDAFVNFEKARFGSGEVDFSQARRCWRRRPRRRPAARPAIGRIPVAWNCCSAGGRAFASAAMTASWQGPSCSPGERRRAAA